ncbi:MAG TPA: hypothetical protein VK929_14185 [Longimicrobiales bacterium]|nr:hypothetical protein [Longimicrobiales bacterium]
MITYRVLLPHPLEPRLLMLRAHGGWRLPEWEDATPRPRQHTAHINRAVLARFGVETTVLRCVAEDRAPGTDDCIRVYELDNRSPAHDTVPSSTWIGRSELDGMVVADPAARGLIGAWFSREGGELPPRGPAWSRRGWYVEALAWAVARLHALGVVSTGSPVQVCAWERAFVMRLATDEAAFLFKATAPATRHEAPLVAWLAARYPDVVPELVAVDEGRGWFLQREVDDAVPLNEVRLEEEWCRTVRRFAGVQRDMADCAAELRALGCPDRRLSVLARRIPRLCADTDAMLLGDAQGLTRQEIGEVAALAPRLLALCEELDGYGLPETLEHGALHADNVVSTAGGPVFLDWADSSVSHPFFGVSQLLSDAAGLVPAPSRESRRLIRDSYLVPWREHAPPETLLRAFEVARALAPVHHATAVHAELLPAADQPWELAPLIPGYLRAALQLLREEQPPAA